MAGKEGWPVLEGVWQLSSTSNPRDACSTSSSSRDNPKPPETLQMPSGGMEGHWKEERGEGQSSLADKL